MRSRLLDWYDRLIDRLAQRIAERITAKATAAHDTRWVDAAPSRTDYTVHCADTDAALRIAKPRIATRNNALMHRLG